MKKLIRKAITVLGSAALIGMTVGSAMAASYPEPFTSNTAIVVGANAAPSDNIAATSVASNLDANAVGGVTTIDGESVSLGSGSSQIYLNTSLNTAITTLTKTDLPTVLAQTTFSGNVDSKLTSTIAIGSNKVTFAKQPSSNTDPVLGITTKTGATGIGDPLYNLSVTMPAIAFNNTDSEGETIKLFGNEFVVSTATTATSLVLFSSAKEVNLVAGGDSPNPSETVIIDGTSYTIELVTGSGTTSATIAVNGESKQVSAGASKKINGIDIAVKSVTESTAINSITASILVGSNKMTFTDNSQVLIGSDDDPVDGTLVSFTGGVNALTGINIAVYAPEASDDVVLEGAVFTDPVFGGFSVVFEGLTSSLDDASREAIVIDKSGDKGMSLTMTDDEGNAKTFDFVYNATTTFLGDSNSYKIYNQENQTFQVNNYTMIGNEDYGHLVQLTRVYNFTGTDYSKDAVTFKDVITGESYSIDPTSEGAGRLTIDGRQYTIAYSGTGDTGSVRIKYPTSDSSAAQIVMFPTIKTEAGALVSLYEPQTYTLNPTVTGILLPDGDGYTTATIAIVGDLLSGNYTLNGVPMNATTTGGANLTVGTLTYNFANLAGSSNLTTVKLFQPGTGTKISAPAVVIFEGKNDTSVYNTIVVDVEANSAGTSTDSLGANDVYFSGPVWDSVSLQSDSDISQSVDIWGTLVTEDVNTASQKIVSIAYPKEQVYAKVAVAESGAVVGDAGVMTVMDTAVSSVAGKNLVVVGGSAINSVAAELLGGALSEDAFTTATGVAAGEFLIQSFTRSGKTALLVAGYNAADTEKAVTYLLNNDVDTTVGKKYKGTSATEASLVVA